jgi:hypothetical protein
LQLTFPDVQVGGSLDSQDVVLTDPPVLSDAGIDAFVGVAPPANSDLQFNPDFSIEGCGLPRVGGGFAHIPMDGACILHVDFQPTSIGEHTTTLQVQLGGGVYSVLLTGSGT